MIDKTRFPDFKKEANIFQNEITILYNVKHPGIVKLHGLIDENEKVILNFFTKKKQFSLRYLSSVKLIINIKINFFCIDVHNN